MQTADGLGLNLIERSLSALTLLDFRLIPGRKEKNSKKKTHTLNTCYILEFIQHLLCVLASILALRVPKVVPKGSTH